LYPGGYYLFSGESSDSLRKATREIETARLAGGTAEPASNAQANETSYKDRLWKGWVLPASDKDVWFVAGSAAYYYRLLESENLEQAMEAQRIRYRGLKLAPDNESTRFHIERAKGVLFLDGLRRRMGDDAFLNLMTEYFSANTTKTVTAQSFLDKAGTTFDWAEPGDGPAYLPDDVDRRLDSAVIVYGTKSEAGTNRYAAEQLQGRYRDDWQVEVPVLRDFEVSDAELRQRDVIFIGRPEINSALAAWAEKLGLDYDRGVIKVKDKVYASERNALVYAAKNPLNAAHMVLVFAGNSPAQTVEALKQTEAQTPFIVLEDGKPVERMSPSARN
jgi:hypothetical protein